MEVFGERAENVSEGDIVLVFVHGFQWERHVIGADGDTNEFVPSGFRDLNTFTGTVLGSLRGGAEFGLANGVVSDTGINVAIMTPSVKMSTSSKYSVPLTTATRACLHCIPPFGSPV